MTTSRMAAPFVVGVSRSGTTLLRLMLDSHPDLAIPPETHFLTDVAKAWEGDPGGLGPALAAMTSHPRWGDFGIEAADLRADLDGRPVTAAGDILRAFYHLYAVRRSKSRFGDKTPRYTKEMLRVESVLPEARFVHLIRDGRDVALSLTRAYWGPDSVSEAALRWTRRVTRARADAQEVRHYTELRYEDLVREPEASLRRVCAFAELPFDRAMLTYHHSAPERLGEIDRDLPRQSGGQPIPASTRLGTHRLVDRPPDAEAVERWRRHADRSDVLAIERVAGDLLEELGYSLSRY